MASPTGTRDEAEGAAEAAARDPLSISPEVKASRNLLIVDDDRTLREGCASVLQLDGFNGTRSDIHADHAFVTTFPIH